MFERLWCRLGWHHNKTVETREDEPVWNHLVRLEDVCVRCGSVRKRWDYVRPAEGDPYMGSWVEFCDCRAFELGVQSNGGELVCRMHGHVRVIRRTDAVVQFWAGIDLVRESF